MIVRRHLIGGSELRADLARQGHRCDARWRRRARTGAAFSRNGERGRGATRREGRPPRATDQQLLGHVLCGAMVVLRGSRMVICHEGMRGAVQRVINVVKHRLLLPSSSYHALRHAQMADPSIKYTNQEP